MKLVFNDNHGCARAIVIPKDQLREAGSGCCSYQERYEAKMKAIREIEKNLAEQGSVYPECRITIDTEDAIQYALDKGTGIEYSQELGMTTKEAQANGDKRYVNPDCVAFWKGDDKFIYDKVLFAVLSNMDLIDFDEWLAVCDCTGILPMSYQDASEIIGVLYECYDMSTLECPTIEAVEAQIAAGVAKPTVKVMFGVPEMTQEHERQIYEVLSRYGTPSVKVSTELTDGPERGEDE